MNDATDDARVIIPGVIKIIGIGQSLRGDDAAGISAVRLWVDKYHHKALPLGVQVELTELPGLELLSLLEGTHFTILVDAVRSGAKSGTIYRLTEDQLEGFHSGSSSSHGWGVAETLSLGRQLAPTSLPPEIVVIGIEAGQLDLGEALSPEVDESLPEVARLIEEIVSAALIHP